MEGQVQKYMHSLKGVTGVITNPEVLQDHKSQLPPAGIGLAVDFYLDAYWYDAAAKLHIVHAYKVYNDVDDFITYLCNLGMAKSEAD